MRIQLQSIPFRLFLFLLISITLTNSEPPVQEKNALLSFIHQVPHASRYEWNSSTSPCDWPGISCDASRSSIITLRLPGAGLIGKIPSNTLSRLSHLRVLSLHYNRLSGPIPSDFSNLTSLRGIYLGNNRLTGEFPLSLTSLTQLNRIDLSNNEFTGAIPVGINNLTNLNILYLQNNNFSGEIPSFSSIQLSEFNVSNNKLNGSIPKQLSKFPESSFKGNLQLCGPPLTSVCNSTLVSTPPSPDFIVPSSPAERNHKKLSTAAIAAIAVAAAVVLLILLICLFFCFVKRRRRRTESRTPKSVPVTTTRGVESGPSTVGEAAGTSSSKDDLTSGGGVDGERNKLVFINNGVRYSFDLEDLLRASAEVLGKGSVGTSYKAVLEEGTTVVVKRLKDVVAAKREFEVQMEVIGGSGCRHENVVPLRAYYFSKDEKLLVSDYFPAGSLSALLHGSRGSGRSALDWESRMKVATGVGRGLSHLHLSGRVVHGNIKSSNVLLRQQGGNNNNKIEDGCLSDYGLNPLFGNSSNPNRGVSGYRAPEVFEARKVTFKSDVYSFGVLLLELLTGKAPNQASLDEEGIDLPRWVQSVVREEWTAEVFDVELMRYNNIEEEMVQVLQIAMSCVQIVPDARPSMPDILRMMEEIPRGSGGDTTDDGMLRQSSDDPSKGDTPPIMPSVTP